MSRYPGGHSSSQAPSPTAIIIDDSKLSRFVARSALVSRGFHVLAEGSSGPEAVALYTQHRPHVIVLDLVIPVFDGIEATRQILTVHPEAHVVICSAFSTREQVKACCEMGVAHFLRKPFEPAKLADIAAGLTGAAR